MMQLTNALNGISICKGTSVKPCIDLHFLKYKYSVNGNSIYYWNVLKVEWV